MPGRAEIARNRNQSLKAPRSGIAERHLEGHVPRHRLGLEIPSWVEKRIQIIYLLADLGRTRRAPVHPRAHLELLAAQHLLVGAPQPRCRSLRPDSRNRRSASVRQPSYRERRARSSLQVGAARGLGLVLPGSTRHVDLDRAARHRQAAAAQAGQPFVLARSDWPVLPVADNVARSSPFRAACLRSASWATPDGRAMRQAPGAAVPGPAAARPDVGALAGVEQESNKAVTATWCWRNLPRERRRTACRTGIPA